MLREILNFSYSRRSLETKDSKRKVKYFLKQNYEIWGETGWSKLHKNSFLGDYNTGAIEYYPDVNLTLFFWIIYIFFGKIPGLGVRRGWYGSSESLLRMRAA